MSNTHAGSGGEGLNFNASQQNIPSYLLPSPTRLQSLGAGAPQPDISPEHLDESRGMGYTYKILLSGVNQHRYRLDQEEHEEVISWRWQRE